MSSPCDVTIYNFTQTTLKTQVLSAQDLEDNGAGINNRLIPACAGGQNSTVARITSKTGHDGSVQVALLDGNQKSVGSFTVKNVKDPQKGAESLEVSALSPYVISEMGYRNSPGNADLRRVIVVAASCR